MITLTANECAALNRALLEGAEATGEDIIGLILKTSGSQLLQDGGIVQLIEKIEAGAQHAVVRKP